MQPITKDRLIVGLHVLLVIVFSILGVFELHAGDYLMAAVDGIIVLLWAIPIVLDSYDIENLFE